MSRRHQPEVAEALSFSTDEDTPRAVALSASDANGDALSYTVVAQPSHGALTGTAPSLTYTPAANYNGPDSFTYKASDNNTDSNVATVSITVKLSRTTRAQAHRTQAPQMLASSPECESARRSDGVRRVNPHATSSGGIRRNPRTRRRNSGSRARCR